MCERLELSQCQQQLSECPGWTLTGASGHLSPPKQLFWLYKNYPAVPFHQIPAKWIRWDLLKGQRVKGYGSVPCISPESHIPGKKKKKEKILIIVEVWWPDVLFTSGPTQPPPRLRMRRINFPKSLLSFGGSRPSWPLVWTITNQLLPFLEGSPWAHAGASTLPWYFSFLYHRKVTDGRNNLGTFQNLPFTWKLTRLGFFPCLSGRRKFLWFWYLLLFKERRRTAVQSNWFYCKGK